MSSVPTMGPYIETKVEEAFHEKARNEWSYLNGEKRLGLEID